MSLQCIGRALSQQARGCSFKHFKPIKQTNLVSRIQYFKTTPVSFSAGSHNHSKLWTIERAFSTGLIVVLPAALLAPSKGLDVLLALSVVMHGHWGIEATVMDYVRPNVFGPAIPKAAVGLVYVLSILTFAGLLQITFNEKGLARTIRNLWSVGH